MYPYTEPRDKDEWRRMSVELSLSSFLLFSSPFNSSHVRFLDGIAMSSWSLFKYTDMEDAEAEEDSCC